MGSFTLGTLVSFICIVTVSARYLDSAETFFETKRSGSRDISIKENVFFKPKETLSPVTEIPLYSNYELSCEAGGSPTPSIHWLKDGHRIEQGDTFDITTDEAFYEETKDSEGRPLVRMGFTRSVLYIDCMKPAMEGVYTCVAETPKKRITSETIVQVDENVISEDSCLMKRTTDVPARQYLWNTNKLEQSGGNVQLFCRAEGVPTPKNTWLDNRNEPITSDDPNYQVLPNGDLVIHKLEWSHMGKFTCISENESGRDMHQTFVYPTK